MHTRTLRQTDSYNDLQVGVFDVVGINFFVKRIDVPEVSV